MGTAQKHALGRRGQLMVEEETTYGTYARSTTPVDTTNLIQYMTCNISKEQERHESKFANPLTRAQSRRVNGKITCEWSVGCEVIPGAAAGIPANADNLLFLAFGDRVTTYTHTVTAFADATGVTISNFVDGLSVGTLAEPGDWTAAVDNDTTAASIKAAYDTAAYDGVTATVSTNVVTVTANQKADGSIIRTMLLTNDDLAPIGLVTTGVSVAYRPSYTQGQQGSVTLHHKFSTYMKALTGTFVEELTLTLRGGDKPMLEFAGPGKDIIYTGHDTVAAPSGADFDVSFPEQFEIDSLVAFRDGTTLNDNSGVGYEVDAVSGSTVTVEAVHGALAGHLVEPFLPPPTAANFTTQPLPGIAGTFRKDSVTLNILEGSFTIKNNHQPFDDEALQESLTDYTEGWLDITGSFQIRGRADEVRHLAAYYSDPTTQNDLELTIGLTTGRHLIVDIDAAEVKIDDDVPEAETVVTTVEIFGLASSDGSDYPMVWTYF